MATRSSKCCECFYPSPRTLQALSKDLRIKPAQMEGEDRESMDLPALLSRKAMKYSLGGHSQEQTLDEWALSRAEAAFRR